MTSHPSHPLDPPLLADLCVPAASTDGRRQSRSVVSAVLLVPWGRMHDAGVRVSPGLKSTYDGLAYARVVHTAPGLGCLLASAASLRMAPGPGTDYRRPSDQQNCRSRHSSANSRPTRLFQH